MKRSLTFITLFILFASNAFAQTPEPTGVYEPHTFKYHYFPNYLRIGKSLLLDSKDTSWKAITNAFIFYDHRTHYFDFVRSRWYSHATLDDIVAANKYRFGVSGEDASYTSARTVNFKNNYLTFDSLAGWNFNGLTSGKTFKYVEGDNNGVYKFINDALLETVIAMMGNDYGFVTHYLGNAYGNADTALTHIGYTSKGVQLYMANQNGNLTLPRTSYIGGKGQLFLSDVNSVFGNLFCLRAEGGTAGLRLVADGTNAPIVFGKAITSGEHGRFVNNGHFLINTATDIGGKYLNVNGTVYFNDSLHTPNIATTTDTIGKYIHIQQSDGNVQKIRAGNVGASGGVTGTGASGRVAFWNGTSSIGGSSTFTYDGTSAAYLYGASIGTTFDNTKAIYLKTNTASTSGSQQMPPYLGMYGHGYHTGGTPGDESVELGLANIPIQSTGTHPLGMFGVYYNIANAGWNEYFAIKSNGALRLSGDEGAAGGVLTSNGASAAAAWLYPGYGMVSIGVVDSTKFPDKTRTNVISGHFIHTQQITLQNTASGYGIVHNNTTNSTNVPVIISTSSVAGASAATSIQLYNNLSSEFQLLQTSSTSSLVNDGGVIDSRGAGGLSFSAHTGDFKYFSDWSLTGRLMTLKRNGHLMIGTTTDVGNKFLNVNGSSLFQDTVFVNTAATANTYLPAFVAQSLGTASSGNQMYGGFYYSDGYGWKTTSTAASQKVSYRWGTVTEQGSSAPTGRWELQRSINGGGFVHLFGISTAGALYDANGNSTGSSGDLLISNGSSSGFGWANPAGMGLLTTTTLVSGNFTGDGGTMVFTIPHGLGYDPSWVVVTPTSSDAAGVYWVTHDGTNIYVNYKTTMPTGSGNISFNYETKP